MRIAFAADHAGADMKSELIRRLGAAGLGYALVDLGGDGSDSTDDYPDFARSLGMAIQAGEADRGILICGSGVGASVAANKMRGIRAAVCHDTYSAHQGVEHDDLNVLTLGARVIGPEPAIECALAFLAATFSGEARHRRRLDKVLAIEAEGIGAATPQDSRRPSRARARATVGAATGANPTSSASAGAPEPATAVAGSGGPRATISLAPKNQADFDTTIARARDGRWAERVFEKDATLWSPFPKDQAAIVERLGWLDSPVHFTDEIGPLEAFGESVRDAGFKAAVIAGMGGSSLAPEVLAKTFGSGGDWLELRVLDSTDPAAVAAVVDDLYPLETLFVVSSKSGTTTEPLVFQADAWSRIAAAIKEQGLRETQPGAYMAAITDPGHSLESIPHHDDLNEVFLNPPDIGGRYSALTYVGLLPASLIGIDLDPFLAAACAMLDACREPDAATNPGLALGIAIGTLEVAGRDKLTFIADPEIEAFGSWLEQLIAESTGKSGVGIVPVDREPLGTVDHYGPDRTFVRLTLAGSAGPAPASDGTSADDLLARLEAAGHPVIRIALDDPMDLAGEFVRWEVATAIAGAVIGIDPFDQPNVEEAKENTRALLASLESAGDRGPALGPWDQGTAGVATAWNSPDGVSIEASGDGLVLVGDRRLRAAREAAGEATGDAATSDAATGGAATGGAAEAEARASAEGGAVEVGSIEAVLWAQLERLLPNGYFAIQAYIAPTPERDAALSRIRALVRDRTGRATTAGYGPRFLHSTGQLHKGGAPIGWFLQLTADHPVDRPIPDRAYTFGTLIDAQALGDFQVLDAHDLPVLRVHLGADVNRGLSALERALAKVLEVGRGM